MKPRFSHWFLIVQFICSTGAAQQGVLDSTFGPGNFVQVATSPPDFVGGINAIAIQPDNKIIAVGGSFVFTGGRSQGFSITRHLANGPLDQTFAGDGSLLIIPINPNASQVIATAHAVAVLPDGRIVVAGENRNDGVPNTYHTMIVWLNADGSVTSIQNLDLSPGFRQEGAYGIAVQSDGKVVVTGEAYNNVTGMASMTLVRFNNNGTLDNSFDGDGILYVALPGPSRGYDVDVQSDGKILVTGRVNTDLAVVRLNSNGTYDSSFDGDGKAVIPFIQAPTALDLEVLRDGKYLLAGGTFSNGSVLVRLSPDGSPDNSFDGDGRLQVEGNISSMVVQSDGKILVETTAFLGGTVQRRLADGSMDPSFGTAGVTSLSILPLIFILDDLALQSDGRIIVAGSMSQGIGRIIGRLTNCVDIAPPQVNCNSTVNLCYNSAQIYEVPVLTATDNCNIQSVNFTITGATTRSGSGTNASGNFNRGTSIIQWTVTDASGNTGRCQMVVTVNSVEAVINDVYAVAEGGSANTIYLGYGPQTLTLTAQATQGTAPFSYSWSTGSRSESTAISSSTTGTHIYSVTINDQNGCLTAVNKQINVVDVRCGNKMEKVAICNSSKTNCVSPNAVAAQLKNGMMLGECTQVVTRTSREVIHLQPEFSISASPNPASNYFVLAVQTSNLTDKITLIVYDVMGKQVLVKKVAASKSIKIGEELRSGVYLIKAQQGESLSYQKLIKTN